ncbi:hypothetical protein QQA43_30540 (plasmid) [Mycolicibacterium vanbaalenii]|uniref:hypothetical protein n=1 Tax=Mycolicibacterium vanbaalenii TaxID=110539 RepID=UPI001F3C6A08|nr:hypothetical protein [Mycolicibacterium vanbaalenii]WND60186.1 hypothetical protein QQA43_30540 [Mycolicibacterium vanbaalenii]
MSLETAEEWRSHSSWYRRVLTAERVGEIFAADPRSLALMPGFLTAHPPSRVEPTPWSLADIYDYLFTHTHRQTTMIPRLYPLPDHPTGPARMLFTKPVEIGPGGQEFVVHAWDPPDGRGHIAIGYPVRDCPDASTPDAARRLRAQLSWASAVIIPANESTRLGHRRWQPTVWVADGRGAGIWVGVEGVAGVERGVWADAANLLRTTLPWWPRGLRERDAMLMWRPGDDPLAITPGTADRDPAALLDVLTTDSSAGLRHTIAAMVRDIEYELCGDFHAGRDRYSPFSGLTHAAFPSLDPQPPRPRTAGEAALFLHQEVANPLIAARAAAVAGGHPIAHSAYVINHDNRHHNLIKEWIERLRPATRRDEIGFQLALSMLPAELRPGDHLAPTGYHVHPDWPDCWVVSAGETVIVTCGTSVPARGVLRQAYLSDGAAFFRDSNGATWPLPYPQATNTDETMAQTLSRLLLDAGADVDDPHSAVPTNPWVLHQIQALPLPMVINADEVNAPR